MPPDQNLPRLGAPLAGIDATERANQAAALGDSLNFRTMHAIATGITASQLAATLFVSQERIRHAVATLLSAGLLERLDTDSLSLTAVAWMRFGRLVAMEDNAGKSAAAAPMAALPVAIGRVAHDLAYRFSSTFSAETVTRYVAESYVLLRQRASVRTHLVALTERYATDRLDALASAQGLTLRDTPEILFVCVQNAGRSQIAAAYLQHFAGRMVHVRTAGSAPAAEVNGRVLRAIEEAEIAPFDDFPKPLTDDVIQAADVIVTMGCEDACPIYPGRRYLDWELDDPLRLDDDGVRRVRDEIRDHVMQLLVELGIPHQDASR